jgi:hypothetical protein
VRFLSLIFLFACVCCAVKDETGTNPDATYSVETFRKDSPGCEAGGSCATYEVSYPVFTALDSAVSNIVQEKINAAVTMGNPQAYRWSMEETATNFIEGFEAFRKEAGDPIAENWYYKANVRIETSNDTLISLSVNDEWFTGGAHGGGGTYFINVNTKTGDSVTLDKIFKPGYHEDLMREAERAFRNVRALADTASLVDHGFEFPDNRFQLTENYGFTREGLAFVYNSYEIAPFAVGPTRITIPYEKLRDWLRSPVP